MTMKQQLVENVSVTQHPRVLASNKKELKVDQIYKIRITHDINDDGHGSQPTFVKGEEIEASFAGMWNIGMYAFEGTKIIRPEHDAVPISLLFSEEEFEVLK